MKIESLDWDSNFFGFKVGRLFIDKLNKAEIPNFSERMKLEKFQVLYLIMNEWDAEINEQVLKTGAKLVDRKTTYTKIVTPFVEKCNTNFPVVEFSEEFFTKKFVRLAFESGNYSRFLLDKGFGRESYEKLYSEWINNSINGKLADKIWIALDEKKIIGFVTTKKYLENTYGQIGLIAILEQYREKRIGQSLMMKCDEWYADNNLKYAKIVTQGDNIAACRFYEAIGYNVEKVEYYYHMWV